MIKYTDNGVTVEIGGKSAMIAITSDNMKFYMITKDSFSFVLGEYAMHCVRGKVLENCEHPLVVRDKVFLYALDHKETFDEFSKSVQCSRYVAGDVIIICTPVSLFAHTHKSDFILKIVFNKSISLTSSKFESLIALNGGDFHYH